jgi:hypothetical protein
VRPCTSRPTAPLIGAGSAILVCLTCGEECAGVCGYCQRAVDSFAIPDG